jgi:dihydroorotate dehydrogenase subfamily 1
MARYKFFEKEISGFFTIPSGIVTTGISILAKIAREIPEIGILTTKSIGLKPREGNKEPIIAEYASSSFINAVGLTNPGVQAFTEGLSKIEIPKDKFLLISIFGDSEKEFKEVAERLYDFADGFELNISCPHSKKYGQIIGQNEELVGRITKSVASVGKPVFIKLSPNLDIKKIVKSAVKNNVSGITAINTRGPELFLHDNYPVLSNEVGGVSGKEILEVGLKCVREIRRISNLPIIACGGISTAEDVLNYKKAGANFFGVGSALAGMNTEEIKKYFHQLLLDLKENKDYASDLLKDKLRMKYRKYSVRQNKRIAEDLFILELDSEMEAAPGQFVFVWLPKKKEKPFSVLDNKPLSLLIQKRGCFTDELSKLKAADTIYIRGPYGNSPELKGRTLLVGGGTGIAALYLFAKRNEDTFAVLGAKDKNHLANFESFKGLCKKVYLVTENGEIGNKGLVTDSLEAVIKEINPEYCVNCGPEPMVRSAIRKESKYINPEKIYSSIDFLTKCGIGLCGSCATSKGYRSCVDGTFLRSNQI